VEEDVPPTAFDARKPSDASRPDRPSGPTRFRWVIVAVLCAVGFVLYIDRINISVAVPWMKQEYLLSEKAVGIIFGAFLAGYAIGLVPGGWLADRFGPLRVLTAAGTCWGALTILTGLMPGPGVGSTVHPVALLIAARFMLGICEGCAFPTFNRALAAWMRRSERALAIGLIHAGAMLGGAFTPPFIAFVIGAWGWRESFMISGIVTLAVALLWRRIATDEPSEHKRVSAEELAIISADKEELHIIPADRAWYGRMVRSRNAYMLCLSELLFGFAGFVFTTWFYTYFVEVRHAGETLSAFLYSLNYVAMAVGAPVGGLLCDLCVRRLGSPWGRRTVPLISISLAGVAGMIAPAIGDNVLSAMVFAVAAGLFFTAASAYWSTLIDITRRGAGVLGGLMNGSGQVGSGIGTVSFAWLQAWMGWERALQLSGLTGVFAGLVWMLIDSSRQIDESAETRGELFLRKESE
jgi:MFS family permease